MSSNERLRWEEMNDITIRIQKTLEKSKTTFISRKTDKNKNVRTFIVPALGAKEEFESSSKLPLQINQAITKKFPELKIESVSARKSKKKNRTYIVINTGTADKPKLFQFAIEKDKEQIRVIVDPKLERLLSPENLNGKLFRQYYGMAEVITQEIGKMVSSHSNITYPSIKGESSNLSKYIDYLVKEKPGPFESLKFKREVSGGKQEKAKHTGFYEDESGKQWMIKMSKKHSPDDVAEVVTSSLLQDFITEKHAIGYDFIPSKDGSMYIKSGVRQNFSELGKRVEENGKGTGWIGSNPRTPENKKKIQAQFKTEEHQAQMAEIIAGSLLLKDSDCQIGNICFYTDKEGKEQMAKFDDGWGLVGLGKPKNRAITLDNLIGSIDFFSKKRGDHTYEFTPTNHYIDYPDIIYSQAFVDALIRVSDRTKTQLLNKDPNSVETALKKIDDAFGDDPARHLKAYKDFAIHLELPKQDGNDIQKIRSTIKTTLTNQLNTRAESMRTLSAQIALHPEFKKSLDSTALTPPPLPKSPPPPLPVSRVVNTTDIPTLQSKMAMEAMTKVHKLKPVHHSTVTPHQEQPPILLRNTAPKTSSAPAQNPPETMTVKEKVKYFQDKTKGPKP